MRPRRTVSLSKFGILMLMSIWRLHSCDEHDFGDDCKYHGDMCNVHPDNCIRRMKEEEKLLRSCYSLHYGPGKLYKTREDTEFWMNGISDYEWPDEAKNLTYTIFRKIGNRKDWTVPGSLSPLPGCCSMTLSDTCTLPKRGPNVTHYFVMPIKDSDKWYCIFEIEEYDGKPDYCEDENQAGCVEFVNGTVRMKDLFIPLSTRSYQPQVDFCFFTPPNDFVNAPNESNWINPVPTRGISLEGEGDDIFASSEDNAHFPCTLVKGKPGGNVLDLSGKYHQSGLGDFVCFFLRLPQSSGEWLNARCQKPLESDFEEDVRFGMVVPLVVTICVCTIVVVCIAVSMWMYKKHLIKFTFRKTMEELPDTLAKDKLGDHHYFTVDGNGKVETVQNLKELPDEIATLDFITPQEEKGNFTTDPEHNNRFQDGEFVKYTELFDAGYDEGIGSPTSTGCGDSGIVFELSEQDVNNPTNVVSGSKSSDEDSGFSRGSIKDAEYSEITSSDIDQRDENGFYEKPNLKSGAYTEKKEIASETSNKSSDRELFSDNTKKKKQDFPYYLKKSAIDSHGGHNATIVTNPITTGYFPKA